MDKAEEESPRGIGGSDRNRSSSRGRYSGVASVFLGMERRRGAKSSAASATNLRREPIAAGVDPDRLVLAPRCRRRITWRASDGDTTFTIPADPGSGQSRRMAETETDELLVFDVRQRSPSILKPQ